MDRNKLAKQIHEVAKEKGWWDDDRNTDEIFMLIITELSEAIEADRESRTAAVQKFKELLEDVEMPDDTFRQFFHMHIKDTISDEIADAYIRCLDYLYYRHQDHIIFDNEIQFSFSDNFAQNIFYICREVTDRNIKSTVAAIEQLAKYHKIDLYWHVEQKIKFNKSREHKHGGKKY